MRRGGCGRFQNRTRYFRPASSRDERSRRARGQECELLGPRQALDLMLALQRRAARPSSFCIHELHWTPARRVFRTMTCIVDFGSTVRIARIAGIQRSVCATHHVHEVHAEHSSTCDNGSSLVAGSKSAVRCFVDRKIVARQIASSYWGRSGFDGGMESRDACRAPLTRKSDGTSVNCGQSVRSRCLIN